ncbi:hypothetical protein EMIT0P176_100038 [Pseudomonas sp. IT-P176]
MGGFAFRLRNSLNPQMRQRIGEWEQVYV